ncbi:MAG TPA: S9 family peptidase [Bacteroidales bacterium]|nr:S9 family peptidase [Bacteroidales bacterium]
MQKLIRTISTILLILIIVPGFAQQKELTLKDAVYMNRDIFPKRINQLNWMGKSDSWSYVENDQLMKSRATVNDPQTIVTLDDLNAGMADLQEDSVKRFPQITYIDDHRFYFASDNKLYTYDIASRNLEKVNNFPEEAENTDIAEKNLAVAYTIDNNLYIALNGEQKQISSDENPGIVNGQTVHRNEFGISKGTYWSPSGKYLAFYRKDETMVTDYPLVNIDTRIAEVKNTKYPMAGMASHHVTLGVYNPENGETVFMKTGEPKEQYLTTVTWDPSEQYIYISLLNRDQNHLKLNKYDVKTGDLVKTLFEESSDKYVEPENPLIFSESLPGRFLWFSERDGYNHLYLFDTEGNLIQQVTKGEWVVTNYLGTDPKGKMVYFSATKESPIEQNLYSIELKSGKITHLSPDHGTHRGMVSHSGKYIMDAYSSTDVASEYKMLNDKGAVEFVMQENVDPLKDYKLGEMSIFTIKAKDGTDLYCRLIKPANFEEGKKYPVFFYVYGGPHSQLVNDSWLGAAGIFQNYMAEQGYVVFTMDNRGTSNRGLAFEQAIFRNLGTLEVSDQMDGVNYLKSLDFVDPDRIGVDGWSYGGFMTISLILKNPDVFKAACAGGPVIDWKYYEVMYGERYMDTPESNPKGYENASLLNKVDSLNTDLLILQGTMDPTVVWQNSLTFIKECVSKGKQVEYFVYPDHEHNVRGKDRIHMYEKIRLFFDERLK